MAANKNTMLGMYLFSEALRMQEGNVVSGLVGTGRMSNEDMRQTLEAVLGAIIGLSQTLRNQDKSYQQYFQDFADTCRRV